MGKYRVESYHGDILKRIITDLIVIKLKFNSLILEVLT